MLFLGSVSNERVQPAPSMGPGIWQLPGDANGLQQDWAQRAGGNGRAGRPHVSRTPGERAPHTPSGVLSGQPLAFVLYTKPSCFLLLAQAPPQSWGPGDGSLEEHKGGAPFLKV